MIGFSARAVSDRTVVPRGARQGGAQGGGDLGEGDLGHGHVAKDAKELDEEVRRVRLAGQRGYVGDELCKAHLELPVMGGEVAEHLCEERVLGLE